MFLGIFGGISGVFLPEGARRKFLFLQHSFSFRENKKQNKIGPGERKMGHKDHLTGNITTAKNTGHKDHLPRVTGNTYLGAHNYKNKI